MPDSFVRGSLKFEKRYVTSEYKQAVAIFEVDCYQPPEGTLKEFHWTKTISALFQPGFLQKSELTRLLEGAKEGSEDLTTAALLKAVVEKFEFKAIDVDDTKIPAGWKATEACFDKVVSYQPLGQVWEITARTTKAVTLGGDDFPADDLVAAFRIWVPVSYSFRVHHRWNPECCKTAPERTPADQVTDSFWPGKIDVWHLPDGLKTEPPRPKYKLKLPKAETKPKPPSQEPKPSPEGEQPK